jgi:glycosyltransferase involved in cell wall biosynthesis
MASYSGFIPAATVQSLLQLRKPCPCAFMLVERQRIDKARNAMALECLRTGADYLLFVDDDNPIPPETLEVFLADGVDIVSAPILGRNANGTGRHELCAFYARTVEVDGRPLRLYDHVLAFREAGPLHRVDACGTGCVLIARRVLEALFGRYREYMFEFGDIRFGSKVVVDGVEYDRRTMSEDCEFSERAVDAGFTIWVDERVRPLHATTVQMIQWEAPRG